MLLDQDVLARDAMLHPEEERPEKEGYVTMAGWRDSPGRPDLVDCVADEFERRWPAAQPAGDSQLLLAVHSGRG